MANERGTESSSIGPVDGGRSIAFTRGLSADYWALIDGTPPEILDLYEVRVAGDRAALTFDVPNVRFVTSADRLGAYMNSIVMKATRPVVSLSVAELLTGPCRPLALATRSPPI